MNDLYMFIYMNMISKYLWIKYALWVCITHENEI